MKPYNRKVAAFRILTATDLINVTEIKLFTIRTGVEQG